MAWRSYWGTVVRRDAGAGRVRGTRLENFHFDSAFVHVFPAVRPLYSVSKQLTYCMVRSFPREVFGVSVTTLATSPHVFKAPKFGSIARRMRSWRRRVRGVPKDGSTNGFVSYVPIQQGEKTMKCKRIVVLTVAMLGFAASAFAQSSGNFSASYYSTACTINSSNGTFGTGGVCKVNSNTVDCEVLNAGIKTSSGNGVTLVITPSAVTGLYTNTNISKLSSSSTAEIGIQVCVTVDGSGADVLGGDSNGCAIYDERFQQLSSNLFNVVSTCALTLAGPVPCNIDLILSTLSAHSYNFIAQVPNGQHTVKASWSVVNVNTAGSASVGACLGPGNVTVVQYKVFQNSGAILQF